MSEVPCSYVGCDRPAHRGGLCWGHCKQKQRGQPFAALVERPSSPMERLTEAALAYAEVDADDDEAFTRAKDRLRKAASAAGPETAVSVDALLRAEMARRGKRGGQARALKLTAERRSELARTAATARWRKKNA